MRFQIHPQASHRECRFARVRRHPGGVPKRDPHARQKLTDTERFGQIVVSAGVQRLDLVPLLPPRGQDDDRRGRPSAYAASYIDTVHVG